MEIQEREPGDRAKLAAFIDAERDAKQRDRYRGVALALDGRETLEIVEAVGRSRRFVQRWAYAYRDSGIDALRPRKQPGATPKLSRQEQEAFARRIEAGPTPRDGVCTLRGRDAVRILEQEFGKSYSLNGAYDLLHRLGFSSLRPRPKHRKNDPAAMEAFKTSAPPLSSRSATPTPTNGSRSGSRTRPGSGSRAR
jgi:transposase